MIGISTSMSRAETEHKGKLLTIEMYLLTDITNIIHNILYNYEDSS